MIGGAPRTDLEIEDLPIGGGKYWRYLSSFADRVTESEAMGLDIGELGHFLSFDPHETVGFFSLRDRLGYRILTMRVDCGELADVRAPGNRLAAPEERALAEASAEELGLRVLALNGLSLGGGGGGP